MKTKNVWRPIKTYRGKDYREVDIWLKVYPSAMSFGWGDAFRVVEAYRKEGAWFHRDRGEERQLDSHYITHWMPMPKGPK